MCGIVGLLGAADAGERRARLARAAQMLAHRGPDGDGFHEDVDVAFAFRRLAIVDVALGNQPMASEDGSVVSMCNGEIYNHEDLRRELAAAGHVLRTRCDAEVIPHLYEEHGDAFLERLNGMFALAVWDARRRRLLLARDRMGEKPLYYRPDAAGLAFGSGLRAVAEAAGVCPEIDPEGLERYLAFLCLPAPHTIYRGFRILPPAHALVAEPGKPPDPPRRWWSLPPRPAPGAAPLGEAEAAEEFWALLVDSVRIRMIGDLPVGLFLSGGLDSSAVAAAHRAGCGGPLRAYTVAFPGTGVHDETPFARAVAGRLGLEHRVLEVSADPRADLERVAAAFDEPFGDPSAWPTWQVCRAARAEGKVVLGGDGGDELLAGYRWTRDHLEWMRVLRLLPRWAIAGARAAAGALTPEPERRPGLLARAARALEYSRGDARTAYLRKYTCFPPGMRARLLGRAPGNGVDPRAEEVLAALPWNGAPADEDVLAVDAQFYLPSDILAKVDRASMAHGLEVRSPFLDHRLVELAFRLPLSYKLSPAGESKRLLRRALAGKLPPEVLVPRKQGFGFPVGAWMRERLRPLVLDRIAAPGARLGAYLDLAPARRWVTEHLEGRQDLGMQLWALLMAELWLEGSRCR